MILKRAALLPTPRPLSVDEAKNSKSWFWETDLTLGCVTAEQKFGMELWDAHMRHSEEVDLLKQDIKNFKNTIRASMMELRGLSLSVTSLPYAHALIKLRQQKLEEFGSWIGQDSVEADVVLESEDDEGYCLEDLLDEVDQIQGIL